MAVDQRPTSLRPSSTPLKLKADPTPRTRPLLIRQGAHYDCFGDGTCCTDIHALGPVTRAEKKAVELLEPGTLVRHKDLQAPVFRTQAHGPCVLRSSRGCELHARHGAEAKPVGCARFPFGLVATPDGGRVTTEHRCPCRTMGERPALTVESALPSLVDANNRLSANGKLGPRVRLAPSKLVSWSRYRAVEEPLLAGLLAGDDALALLGVKPFGKLRRESFRKVGEDMQRERDGTSYGEAMQWFGSALIANAKNLPLELGQRPWSASFAQAEARSPNKAKATAVLNDWIADLLWSLDWAFVAGSFEEGKRELATLYAVADAISKRLIKARVRPDRAAAEAVMIAEVGRQSEPWERVQNAL